MPPCPIPSYGPAEQGDVQMEAAWDITGPWGVGCLGPITHVAGALYTTAGRMQSCCEAEGSSNCSITLILVAISLMNRSSVGMDRVHTFGHYHRMSEWHFRAVVRGRQGGQLPQDLTKFALTITTEQDRSDLESGNVHIQAIGKFSP